MGKIVKQVIGVIVLVIMFPLVLITSWALTWTEERDYD